MLAALTERELLWLPMLWCLVVLFFEDFVVKLDKVTVLCILRVFESFLHANLSERTEDTGCIMHVFSLKLECLQRSQVLLASLTDDHRITKRKLFASDGVLFDHFSLLHDSFSELLQHAADKFVVEVDLLCNLLNVDWL